MICRNCGYQNTEAAHYCDGCGRKLMQQKSEGRKRRIWVAALLLIIVIIAGLVFTLGRKEKDACGGVPIVDEVSVEITQVLPMEDGVIAVLYTDGTVRISGDDSLANAVSEWEDVSKIDYTRFSAINNNGLLLVGLTESGTVLTTEGSITGWNNVDKLYLAYGGILGVTDDGNVLAYGTWEDDTFQAPLSDVEELVFSEIQFLSGCLRKNGSVCFFDSYGYLKESDWSDVKELRDSGHGFYAIMNDGTVDGQIDDTYEGLTGAVKVVDYCDWVFGISEDGRLLTHNNENISMAGGTLRVYGPEDPDREAEIDISQFNQIRDILAFNGLVLLNEDGSVEALCEGIDWDLRNWKNIQSIYGGDEWDGWEKPTLYGIRQDGTVIVAQREAYSDEQSEQDNYRNWNLKEIYIGDGGVVGLTTGGKLVGDGAYANTDFSVFDY